MEGETVTEEDVRKLLGLTRKLASELSLEMSMIFGWIVEYVGENSDHEAPDHRSLHVHLLAPYRKLIAALHNEESREWLDSLDWTMMRFAADPRLGVTSFEAVWRIATDLEQAIDRVLLADDDDRLEAIQNLQDVVRFRPEVARLWDAMQSEAAVIIKGIRAHGESQQVAPIAASAVTTLRNDEPSESEIEEARKLCRKCPMATKQRFLDDLVVGSTKAGKLMAMMREEGLLQTKARRKNKD